MAIRFVAPTGFEELKAQVEYTMLRNDNVLGRVTLVGFCRKRGKDGKELGEPVPHMVRLTVDAFRRARTPPKADHPPPLDAVRERTTLPRWLAAYESLSSEGGAKFDERRKRKNEDPDGARPVSARDEADRRLGRISVAVEDVGRILTCEDPDRELNRLARSTVPKTNETRYRLWFYAYLAYDWNSLALLPRRPELGKWDRHDQRHAGKGHLFGADKIHFVGTAKCWTSKAMIEQITQGFLRHARLGGTIVEAWSLTIRRDLGGKVEFVDLVHEGGRTDKRPAAFHPDGLPLPSYDKFRYYIYRELGQDFVRTKLYGKQRVEEEQPVIGSYSDAMDNIGQQANFDSRQVTERPKSYLGKEHLPPLQAVDLIGCATGRTDGIGFSLGAESGRAYRNALFCAAIPKPKFGQIIGYPITEEEWSGHGLPRAIGSDRGAGCSEEVRAAARRWIGVFGMTRSYTPKDNSTAEAKHPRGKKILGAPGYNLSEHTVGDLIKREVERVILKNRTDNALARADDKAVVEHGVNTPNRLHDYLMKDYRTELIQIPFADAVRAFLDPVEFEGGSDGRLYLKGRAYQSARMLESGLAQAVLKGRGKFRIKGYVYQLATRFTWVEYRGEIIEVEAQGRDDPGALNASLPEREAVIKARSRASGELQQAKPWHVAASEQKFREETGKEWNAGRRRTGRAKISRAALDEARRINDVA